MPTYKVSEHSLYMNAVAGIHILKEQAGDNMDNNSCIVLKQVNKSFGEKNILKGVDLQIPQGHIYGLLGPSGCGKSTMVKIMAGILSCTAGEVIVLGESVPKLSLMNKIGYMAQGDALYSTLSAAENLHFFGSLYGMNSAQIRKKSIEVMELVNLGNEMHTPVGAYSGGMKRRLSLAISILHSPPLLILDEPTVGIDPVLRKSIWIELNKMADQGVSIVVTTHVMDEVDRCHNIAMLRNGRIIAEGTPKALQENVGAKSIEDAFIYYGGGQNES